MNIEIERKFLVKDGSYKAMAAESHRLTQGYICKENGRTVRVRLWDNKGILTIKGAGSASGMSDNALSFAFLPSGTAPRDAAESIMLRLSAASTGMKLMAIDTIAEASSTGMRRMERG